MSEPLLLVILPAERAGLAPAVLAAGGTPVVDLTCGAIDAVPEGAWVRVLAGQDHPGTGPVVLADRAAPVRGRPTWLERTEPGPVPGGYAGIILRGREAGGHCAKEDGLTLLARHGHGAIQDRAWTVVNRQELPGHEASSCSRSSYKFRGSSGGAGDQREVQLATQLPGKVEWLTSTSPAAASSLAALLRSSPASASKSSAEIQLSMRYWSSAKGIRPFYSHHGWERCHSAPRRLTQRRALSA